MSSSLGFRRVDPIQQHRATAASAVLDARDLRRDLLGARRAIAVVETRPLSRRPLDGISPTQTAAAREGICLVIGAVDREHAHGFRWAAVAGIGLRKILAGGAAGAQSGYRGHGRDAVG